MSAKGQRLAWIRDPRILFGLLITAVCLWYAMRGVDLALVGRHIARANLLLLVLPSVPAYVAMTWVRALRWRHLTNPVQAIDSGPLFRATAVGFMANNIFPLRLGEFIRAWYLARESGASSASIFATVIVERLLDAVVVIGLAAVVLGAGGVQAAGLELRQALPVLVAVAMVPALGVGCLRMAPEASIRLAGRVAGVVLPRVWTERLEAQLRKLAGGLGALSGGRHLAWLAFHSVVLWLVMAVVPFAAALLALDVDLGGPLPLLAASFSLLFWIGAAVAVPSAPGFFGPYHAACVLALLPFGVSRETALALGTLCHVVFWLTTTSLGLLVLRSRRTSLEELEEAASERGKDPLSDRR